ncbi:unnamed protein product [Vitrella brassicaformis CCMP3155]|uniref:PCI domain-containing protein n=1 Tax=Vitrella brassicaformis (strain CCMP3155) TaxID=1169540 RepID=A0A0G4EV91_VITBC|nr:unnamed protein product [Vitrella brassicaformis CCMP3155]|eukprot:CEM02180.1 unnamed protein product [Vitrella brassicaformis CCMP3155]
MHFSYRPLGTSHTCVSPPRWSLRPLSAPPSTPATKGYLHKRRRQLTERARHEREKRDKEAQEALRKIIEEEIRNQSSPAQPPPAAAAAAAAAAASPVGQEPSVQPQPLFTTSGLVGGKAAKPKFPPDQKGSMLRRAREEQAAAAKAASAAGAGGDKGDGKQGSVGEGEAPKVSRADEQTGVGKCEAEGEGLEAAKDAKKKGRNNKTKTDTTGADGGGGGGGASAAGVAASSTSPTTPSIPPKQDASQPRGESAEAPAAEHVAHRPAPGLPHTPRTDDDRPAPPTPTFGSSPTGPLSQQSSPAQPPPAAAAAAAAASCVGQQPSVQPQPLFTTSPPIHSSHWKHRRGSYTQVGQWGVTDRIQCDRYLNSHHQHLVRNIRMRTYTQFLEHHVSVTVTRMASTFGVSADFIEGDLDGLIRSGDISAAINKEEGAVNFKFTDPAGSQQHTTPHQTPWGTTSWNMST